MEVMTTTVEPPATYRGLPADELNPAAAIPVATVPASKERRDMRCANRECGGGFGFGLSVTQGTLIATRSRRLGVSDGPDR